MPWPTIFETLRKRSVELRRFIIVGFANTAFTYAVYLAVNVWTSYVIAFTVSFSSGILFSAILNSRYSFSVSLRAKNLLLFAIICVVNYIIGLYLLRYLIDTLGVHESIAPLIGIVILIPISFAGARLTLAGARQD